MKRKTEYKFGLKKLFIGLWYLYCLLGYLNSPSCSSLHKTHIIYFYDIEIVCVKQIDHQMSPKKENLDYCIHIYMILMLICLSCKSCFESALQCYSK